MSSVTLVIIIVITSVPAVASSEKLRIVETVCIEIHEFLSPVLLSVVLGVVVVHVNLVMVVGDHGLLAIKLRKS